jgi:cytochrome c
LYDDEAARAARIHIPFYGVAMNAARILVAAAALVLAAPLAAQSPDDLLKKNGCTACHAIDKKVIGPAYNDVSVKYKGDAGAAAKLTAKVKQGGAGVWGPIPMPPQPISDAELKVVVPYILGLRK